MKIFVALLSIVLFFSNIAFAQESKPLQIIEKPRAGYPDGSICAQGVVRLRVQFLASGEIGKIQPVLQLPYGLTESAVEAAKKIKFKPATRDGLPLTVVKVVEYIFTHY